MKHLIDWLLSGFGMWSSKEVPIAAELSIQLRSTSVRTTEEIVGPVLTHCDKLVNEYANAEVKFQTEGLIVHRWGYVTELKILIRRVSAGEIENENKFPNQTVIREFFERLVDELLDEERNKIHGGAHYINKGIYRTCVGTCVNATVKFRSGRKMTFRFFPEEANRIPMGAG